MIRPDIICTQPSYVDFPLWRFYLEKNRAIFNKIYIGLSNAHRSVNVFEFERKELARLGATIVEDSGNIKDHDWRSSAVNRCLALATSDRMLFLEQDFVVSNDNFWKDVIARPEPLIGFKEDLERSGRLHPAFLLVDRSILNKTSLQFSAMPPAFDHFGKVSEELEAQVSPIYLEDLFPNQWEHLAGLTHNYSLVMNGEQPCYKKERFVEYNKQLLTLPINQCPDFVKVIRKSASL